MSYSVYIIRSSVNGDLYIGGTKNVKNRVGLHNDGKVKSTKSYRPWKLLETHEYASRSRAVKGERFYKQHQQKDLLRKKYGHVVK